MICTNELSSTGICLGDNIASINHRFSGSQCRSDVVVEADIEAVVMPTRIFWCSRDGELTAVQVWYGGYDPLAGVLHGALNEGDYCTEDILDTENIEEVTIYHDSLSNVKRVVGLKIK